MKVFTIKNETNEITVHASVEAAEAIPNAARFRTEGGLAKLAADWPMSRLVEIWNGVPGVTPVAKFTDRATGVSRIWKMIQTFGPLAPDTADLETEASEAGTEDEPVAQPELAIASHPETPFAGEPTATNVAPQSPDVAPAEATAPHETTLAKKAATEPTGAKGPRESSKTNQVIAMLNREGGTTIEEVMTAMGWQKHTTRAMLSAGGALTKKHGLVITSEKVGEKRVYSIKA